MLLFGTEDQPDQLGVKEQDGGGNNPGDHRGEPRICEFTHLGAVARKLDQRNDRASITICPARVPVSVEFWPDARSAHAKRVLAKLAPSTGLRSL